MRDHSWQILEIENFFMKRIAIFPGSFNPFHEGHLHVVQTARKSFDEVWVLQCYNPEKNPPLGIPEIWGIKCGPRVKFLYTEKMLQEYINEIPIPVVTHLSIVKGLRNAQDLEYETTMQYWNEDLGLTLPHFYVIAPRELRHISSGAIRHIERFKHKLKIVS